MMLRQQFTIPINDDDELTATVVMTNPGDPGRLSGPPEDCYPPEGPEFEVSDFLLNGKPAEPRTLAILEGFTDTNGKSVYDEFLELAYSADWGDFNERDPDAENDARRDDARFFGDDANYWGE